MEKKIICLMGPTASGKTALAIELASKLPCSIISVDSGMVYRGLDIGTAKPTKKELEKAPHSLINICDPDDPYSAGRFREDALKEIENIFAENRIPLLVGGTMLYFRVLIQGLSDLPTADLKIREKLNKIAKEHGTPYLHKYLAKIDPIAASRISENDLQRIQRALEIYELTGKTPTEMYSLKKTTALPYQAIKLALLPNDRSLLHTRIEERFDTMLKLGFIEEVEKLFHNKNMHRDLPSMRAVGYRQVWQYLENKIDRETMRTQAIIATRQLAKRQMTWLRSFDDLICLDSEDTSKHVNKIISETQNSKTLN